MKLSREEETFLRHWMHDEVHYQEGVGPAKELQVFHRASPADLADLIAAAIPNVSDQEAAGNSPPTLMRPIWPWSQETFRARLEEARDVLAERFRRQRSEESPSRAITGAS
jgi:hypothetical protein